MRKEDNKSSLFVLGIGAVISIVRYLLRGSTDLTLIMASVNIFALIFVIWTLIEDIKNNLYTKIEEFKVSDDKKHKIKNVITFSRSIIIILCFIIIVIFFLFKFRSSTGNDIMAIIALCISIETNHISSSISNFIIDNIKL